MCSSKISTVGCMLFHTVRKRKLVIKKEVKFSSFYKIYFTAVHFSETNIASLDSTQLILISLYLTNLT